LRARLALQKKQQRIIWEESKVADVRDSDHVSTRRTGVIEELAQNGKDNEQSWPEKDAESSKGQNARSYFREHPVVKWALIVLALAAIVTGVALWRYSAVRESTDDAQIDGHITPISARVAGTVKAIHVNDNQYVKAGDVLIELDPAVTKLHCCVRKPTSPMRALRHKERGVRFRLPRLAPAVHSQMPVRLKSQPVGKCKRHEPDWPKRRRTTRRPPGTWIA
jgi:acetyl/propionyl-CoA carboxylase alpha subunit